MGKSEHTNFESFNYNAMMNKGKKRRKQTKRREDARKPRVGGYGLLALLREAG